MHAGTVQQTAEEYSPYEKCNDRLERGWGQGKELLGMLGSAAQHMHASMSHPLDSKACIMASTSTRN